MDRAKADVLCAMCSQSFKVTQKNVDAHKHAEGKHPKKTWEECFPDLCEQEEEDEGDVDDELPVNKKVWKCAFTGNVMFSDGYTMEPIYEGQVMEVKALDVTIGGNVVVNLVAQHALKEVSMDKAAFMAAIKEFLKRAVGHLKENGKDADIIKAFRGQATEFVKFVVGKFADFTFYAGENGDATGQIAYCYQKEEDDYLTKTFCFMNVALIEETL